MAEDFFDLENEKFPETLKYLLIGRGRVARSFFYHLRQKGHQVILWSRGESLESLQKAFEASDLCLLAISDASIRQFVSENAFLKTKKLIHFSGALEFEGILGFHPLMSFGTEALSAHLFDSMHFVGTENEFIFKETFPYFKNTYQKISKEQKLFYHANCVLGGNFVTLLWQEFLVHLSKLGLNEAAAWPYFEALIENLKRNPETALSGPLQRKDYELLDKHIRVLKGTRSQKLYKNFVETYLPDWKETP